MLKNISDNKIEFSQFPTNKTSNNILIGKFYLEEELLNQLNNFDAEILRIFTIFDIEDLINQFLLN